MNKKTLKAVAAEVINLGTAYLNGNKSPDVGFIKAFAVANVTATVPALLGNIAGDYVTDSTLKSFGAGLVAAGVAQQGVAYLLTTDKVKGWVRQISFDTDSKLLKGDIIQQSLPSTVTYNTASALLQYVAFEAIDYYFPSEEIHVEINLVGDNA